MEGTQSHVQLTHKLHTCDPQERKRALEELGGSFRVNIPVEVSLALKADLNIPWNIQVEDNEKV